MSEILAILSILIALMTFLFDLVYPKVTKILETSIPDKSRIEERKETRRGIFLILISRLLPILLLFLILFYLCLPTTIEVCTNSMFDLWGFDILKSFFVLLEFIVFVFVAITGILLLRVINKYRSIGKS